MVSEKIVGLDNIHILNLCRLQDFAGALGAGNV